MQLPVYRLLLVFLGLMVFCGQEVLADQILTGNTGTRLAINTQNADLPSADLICSQKQFSPNQLLALQKIQGFTNWCDGKTPISPTQANSIKAAIPNSPYILSSLNPDASVDWFNGIDSSADINLDQALPIQDGNIVNFIGEVGFNPNFIAFNIQDPKTAIARPFDLFFGRTLHTILLRKELVRRLGYKVQPIKYLHEVVVHFPDLISRNQLLKIDIGNTISTDPGRWCFATAQALKDDPKLTCKLAPSNAALSSELDILFQDVAIKDATDHVYNLAISAPFDVDTSLLQPATSRSLRALAIPFGFVDVTETVNQLSPYVMQTYNGNLTIYVPDNGIFSCSLDDAIWATQRLLALNEAALTSIVRNSYFPREVAELLVEKLKARRDSLIDSFNAVKPGLKILGQAKWQDANLKISDPPNLVSGKLANLDSWSGYASRYAYGDPESPLAQLKYFFYSLIEANVIDAILNQINTALPSQTSAMDKVTHQNILQKQIRDAMAQYAKTGKPQAIKIAKVPWVGPLADFGFEVSRQVIAGPFMGTNNDTKLIELVDTYGYYGSIGVYVGVQGLQSTQPVSAQGTAKMSYTFSRVKPLDSLKGGIQEPLTNLYLPNLFNHVSDIFKRANGLNTQTPPLDSNALQKAVTADMNNLTKFLAVGDSLIITESINFDESITAQLMSSTNFAGALQGTLKGSAQQLLVSRTHLYRADASHIQVFRDKGDLDELGLSLTLGIGSFPSSFPILSVSGKVSNGEINTKFFNVNIEPALDPSDPDYNAAYFQNAAGIIAAIKSGSTELLNSVQPATQIKMNFTDKALDVKLLFLVGRSLSESTDMTVTGSDGSSEDLISLSEGYQSGNNFQGSAMDAANYVMQTLADGSNFSLSAMANANPGETFLGSSQTRTASFEGLSTGNALTFPFVKIKYRWEGWEKSAGDAMKLIDQLDQTYGYKVFPDNALSDTTKLQLYNINIALQIYPSGIKTLLSTSPNAENKMVQDLQDNLSCDDSALRDENCASLQNFDNAFKNLQRSNLKPRDRAQYELDMVSSLEKVLPFNEFLKALGGYLFVYPEIDGFRVGSETLSLPVIGNTFGHQEAPYLNGIISSVENVLGLRDGEFYGQYLRDVL